MHEGRRSQPYINYWHNHSCKTFKTFVCALGRLGMILKKLISLMSLNMEKMKCYVKEKQHKSEQYQLPYIFGMSSHSLPLWMRELLLGKISLDEWDE